MNLNVTKDNEPLFQVDLAKEIEGTNGAALTFFVGRSNSCQVVLDDKQVSREHAKITYDNGAWSIEKASDFNLLSLNGTSCNEATLNNGDLINIGPFAISVSLPVVSNPMPSVGSGLDDSAFAPTDDDMEMMDDTVSHVDVGLGMDEATELLTDDDLAAELGDDLGGFDDDLGDSLDGDLDDDLGDLDGDLGDGLDSGDSDGLSDDLGDLDAGFDDDLGDGLASGDDDFSNDIDENQDGFGETSTEFSDGEESFDEGFADDGFEDDGDYGVDTYDDDEKTQVVRSFANFALEVFGEFAPYDKFVIEKPETFIGRDPEKCDIVLNDPEVSGVHAVIKKNAITCTLEDLKSANGTILNGERINSHELTSEDEFLIGSTSFTVKIESDFIEQEKDRIMPVEQNQVVEVEEVIEVDENFVDEDGSVIEGDALGSGTLDTKPKSLFSKEALKDPQQRKKLLYGLVGLLMLWVFLDDGETQQKPKATDKKAAPKVEEKKAPKPNQKILTPEEKEFVESQYLLANQYFSEGKYGETIQELDKIFAITPEYKNAKQLKSLAKEGLEAVAKLLEEKRIEKERKIREQKVKELVGQAKEATEKNQVEIAEGLFQEILKLDPENFEVTQLKLRINAYKQEQQRIALEKAQKKAERMRQVQELSPGKTFYLSKDWYKAILKLQDFLRQKDIDEDLTKEASQMLEDSKQNLNSVVNPLIGKARSLKEGQDLKGAYELYLEVLNYHPAHEEALNEMDEIREKLELRSKRVYREAIIAESLSLYNDAKEKFQEVQQISPTDSEYYQKATDKLKDYLD